jgi:NTP pyrophosphatase (non-canonical NTP hydrolase)
MNKFLDMDFKKYQESAKTFILGDFKSMPPMELAKYCALGLSEESGEVAGKVKKTIRDNHSCLDSEKCKAIAFELGDVLWYLTVMADTLGYTLEDIARMNIEKLTDRRNRGVIQGSGDNR